ncbi:MAG: Zn-ribbon domain-containing OB-fold protein, partial [Dehalococcoidia bacterium]
MSEQQSKDKRGRAAPRNQPFLEEIEARPFWANLKEHRLTVQRCSECSRFRHPPQALCASCLASEFEWVPLSGKGKVYSHVTYCRAWHPAYQDKIPY